MKKVMKQQATIGDIEARASGDNDAGSSSTNARAEMDRLFAVASKSFASMTEGSSEKFLKRSRQTGGQ